MSERYEWIQASDTPIDFVDAGTALGYGTVEDHALVMGDPQGTALVIEGSRNDIRTVLRAALRVVEQTVER